MPPTRNAWRDALRASRLPAAQRAVAQALAAYWPTGTTLPILWCSVARLAGETGYSDRTVKRAMAALQDAGWLVLVREARQHHAPQYAPAIPPGDSAGDPAGDVPPSPLHTPQGGQRVTPGPVDNTPDSVENDSQGGHLVTPGETPGVTSTTARGDTVSPNPETQRKYPPTPLVHSGTTATAGDTTGRGNYPQHIHEANAAKALAALVTAGRLPITAAELLEHAYRAGHGDPWAGYLVIKPYLTRTLDDVRDQRAVLIARLRSA